MDTVVRLAVSVMGFLLRCFLSAVWNAIWFRWLYGDTFDAPLADQSWKQVLLRILKSALVVIVLSGVLYVLWMAGTALWG